MQIARKQLLGFGGLALVAAITTFAYNLPASAVSAGADAKIEVTVYSKTYETVIQSPLDGSVHTNNIIAVSNIYSHASTVKYTISKLNDDGTEGPAVEIPSAAISGFDVSGTNNFNLDMDEYGSYGTYVLRSILNVYDDLGDEDSVSFVYTAAELTGTGINEDNNNPLIDFNYGSGVAAMTFQAYNKETGEPLFSTPIKYTVENAGVSGSGRIELPFASVNAKSGDYYVLANAYGTTDVSATPLVSGLRADIEYTAPMAPEVPDTGALLAALNISRADFVITGMLSFAIITVLALVIMHKARKSSKR